MCGSVGHYSRDLLATPMDAHFLERGEGGGGLDVAPTKSTMPLSQAILRRRRFNVYRSRRRQAVYNNASGGGSYQLTLFRSSHFSRRKQGSDTRPLKR